MRKILFSILSVQLLTSNPWHSTWSPVTLATCKFCVKPCQRCRLFAFGGSGIGARCAKLSCAKKSAKRDREFIIAEGRKSAGVVLSAMQSTHTSVPIKKVQKRGEGGVEKDIKVNETAPAILLCGNTTCRRKQLPDQYASDNILLCCTETACKNGLQ